MGRKLIVALIIGSAAVLSFPYYLHLSVGIVDNASGDHKAELHERVIEREELATLAARISEKEAKTIQKFTAAVKSQGVSSSIINEAMKKNRFAPKTLKEQGITALAKAKQIQEQMKNKINDQKDDPKVNNLVKQNNKIKIDRSVFSPHILESKHQKEITTDPKRGTKGTLKCNGVEVDSEVIYWRNVPGDSTYESPITPHHGEHHETYITFRYDMGGWNNIRMGIEIMVVTAHAMGRTLVVPPIQNLYLLGEPSKDENGKKKRRALGFEDFFDLDLLKTHQGLHVMSMEQFLKKEGTSGKLKGGKLPPNNDTKAWGNEVWKYLSTVSDLEPKWSGGVLAMPAHLDHLNAAGDGGASSGFNSQETNKRLKKFAGPRRLMYYTKELQDAKLLYFPADGQHRLLQHHYAFNFFADTKMQSFYKRLIRDYMRYQDEIQCAGHELVALLRRDAEQAAQVLREEKQGEGFDSNNHSIAPYYALHIRRGDFQFKDVKISAGEILQNLGKNQLIPRGAVVYISTDDPKGICQGCVAKKQPCPVGPEARGIVGCIEDPSWDAFTDIAGWKVKFLGDYLKEGALNSVNPNYYGMVESIVCSRADIFVGTWFSTFTGYIHRLRGYHGLGEQTYYHTTGKKENARSKESVGHGFSREWRYGWTDDQGGLI